MLLGKSLSLKVYAGLSSPITPPPHQDQGLYYHYEIRTHDGF